MTAATALEPASASAERPRAHGKYVFVGDRKFYVRGVTYGPFRSDGSGNEFHLAQAVRDFREMSACGVNAVRTYTVPPRWFLDVAHSYNLRVMVGIPWEQHIAFLENAQSAQSIEQRVRAVVRSFAEHPAVLCYAVGNEIPAPIVRWYGHRRIEAFLHRLCQAAKAEDPGGLVSYINYPTTEYLELPFLDLVGFNVYLESEDRFQAYLGRLQNLAGERPLIIAELGLDSRRHGEGEQARALNSLSWRVGICCFSAYLPLGTELPIFGATDTRVVSARPVAGRTSSPELALAAVVACGSPVPAGCYSVTGASLAERCCRKVLRSSSIGARENLDARLGRVAIPDTAARTSARPPPLRSFPWRCPRVDAKCIPRSKSFQFWSETWQTAERRLESLENSLRTQGTTPLRGSDYERWDLEVRGGALGACRLRMAIEEHGAGRQMIRLRCWPHFPSAGLTCISISALAAAVAALDGALGAFAFFAVLAGFTAYRAIKQAGARMAAIRAAIHAQGLHEIARKPAQRAAQPESYLHRVQREQLQ